MSHRHPKWEERLVAFVDKARQRKYEYGKWDCLLMPAAAIKEITGKDLAKGKRGKYSNQTGSLRYLKQLGFDSPEALLDDYLEEKPIGFAQRGDIVLAKDGIPGVCLGDFSVSVAEGEEGGLARVPRSDWVKAWAVGEQHASPPEKKK